MQFASHEAPARYLLRNNLGSGHCGAVRIRHCQTKAMLNPAIYGLGKFLLVLVFSRAIFANFFRKTGLPPIIKLFFVLLLYLLLRISSYPWITLISPKQFSIVLANFWVISVSCATRMRRRMKRIKLCFKFLRHVWYDSEIISKKFIFVTPNFSWDSFNWSLLFFVFSSCFLFTHSYLLYSYGLLCLTDFCDLSYLVVYSHNRKSILKWSFRWLEVQLPLIFLRRIVSDKVAWFPPID